MPASHESSSAPLVFLRPIGIAAADAMRLMEAAKRLDDVVRWRMAPVGVAADVYIAHANRVHDYHEADALPHAAEMPVDVPRFQDLEHPDWRPGADFDPALYREGDGTSSNPMLTLGNTTGHRTGAGDLLQLDRYGWYRDHPVCVLGSKGEPQTLEHLVDMQVLRFPSALHQMIGQLRRIESEIIRIRMLYELGHIAWGQRPHWVTHRFHIHGGAGLLAVIDPAHWRLYIRDKCTVQALEDASVERVPSHDRVHDESDFHGMSLECALWEFAKRCPESWLAQSVPASHLRRALSPWRATELSKRQLGEHCAAVLGTLDIRPMTAKKIQTSLRIGDVAMMRALASLTLIETIRVERKPQRLARWLPRWFRRWLVRGR